MYRFYGSILETETGSVIRMKPVARLINMAIGAMVIAVPLTVRAQPPAPTARTPQVQNSVNPNLSTTVTSLQPIHAVLSGDAVVTEGTRSYTTHATRAATGLTLSLRETPQSVSVITRQRIEDQNMLSVKDVMAASPGISIQNYDTERYSFNARGFSISNYLYDGVLTAFSAPWSAGESSIDPIIYDRVEVVRGANGLLTGAGNPSASVNFIRKHADSQQFKANLSLGAGSFDTYRTTADLSTPLSSDGSVRGRVVAAYQKNHSFMDRYSSRRAVIYGTAEADLTENTVLRVGFNYQDNAPRGSAWGGFPLWYSDGTRTNWDRSLNMGTDWSKWATTTKGAFLNLEHAFGNGWKVDALLNHSNHRADEKLLYLYSFPDRQSGLGMSALAGRYFGERKQNSADVKISGPFNAFGREHELVAGASYGRQRSLFNRRAPLNTPPVGNFLLWDGSYPEPAWGEDEVSYANTTTQSGLYAATRLSLTDKLKLILGARYTQWHTNQGGSSPYQFRKAAITPYAGILYDLNDNLTVYTSYSTIFNPQDAQDRNGRWLDPLQGHDYELGLKGEFLDGKLNASIAVFQIDQDNVKQADVGHFVPGTTSQAYFAAKGTRSRGYDIEISGEALPGWNIMAGLTHWTASDGHRNPIQTNQPRSLFKMFTTYRLPGQLHALTVGGGVTWQSRNYTNGYGPKGSERVSQGSYALVDLVARYEFSDRASLKVNLNNLFNRKYYSQIGFYNQGAWGSPRNVMATLSYQY